MAEVIHQICEIDAIEATTAIDISRHIIGSGRISTALHLRYGGWPASPEIILKVDYVDAVYRAVIIDIPGQHAAGIRPY
jgi:hypothetical protein